MQTLTSVASAVPATPRPPSGRVPSCPTMAESASRNSGSATSAPNAGTARRRISRSYAEATRELPEPVGGPGGARFSLRNRLRPSSLRHQRALLDQLRYADDVGHHLTERGRVGQQPGVLARDRDARPGYQRVPQRLDEPATSRCCLLFGPNDTTLATSVWGRQSLWRRAASPVERSGTWPSRATVTASQAPGGTVDGAHALLETLAAAGVEVCFANPGTTELPLVRALEATPGVRAILGLFEGVCTGAADGYGRMIGRPAATLLHLGPGLANGLANLHNARRAGTPVVNLVGDHATWHLGVDAPLTSDSAGLAVSVSRWVRTAASAAGLAAHGADAAVRTQRETETASPAMSLVSGASTPRCQVAWSPTRLTTGVPARRALCRLASPLANPGPRCSSVAAGRPIIRPYP